MIYDVLCDQKFKLCINFIFFDKLCIIIIFTNFKIIARTKSNGNFVPNLPMYKKNYFPSFHFWCM